MITIGVFFRVGSVSYNGGKTHDRNSKCRIIMEICRTYLIMSGNDMLGADKKNKTKTATTHKRSLTCSNWSSVLQRFFHGDKTIGFGGWLARAARQRYGFSCDESQRAAASAEELKGWINLTSFCLGREKKRDFHDDIIADGMCHWYSCWTMTDAFF